MAAGLKYGGQIAICAVFAGFIGYFSSAPHYVDGMPSMAQLKVSFAHSGLPKGECHVLDSAERALLAPNMRRAVQCPRERLPVRVEIDVDGRTVLSRTIPPSGLHKDGPAVIYQVVAVPPGARTVAMRLRNSARDSGYDFVQEERIVLHAGQSTAVDFKGAAEGFVLYEGHRPGR